MAATLPRGERLLKQQQAFVLCAEFWSIKDIAEKLEVSEVTVRNWLHDFDEKLLKEFVPIAERIKTEQTLTLKHLARESYAAWEKSKLDAQSETVTTGGEGGSTSRTTKGQCGDPRFIGEIRNSLADIRAIWGAEAPKQAETYNRDVPFGPEADAKLAEDLKAMLIDMEKTKQPKPE